MRIFINIFIITLASITILYGQGWQGRKSPDKNALYGELLGKGHLFTLYYERMVSSSLGLNIGVSVWPEFLAIPAFASWYPVEDVHSPYVDIGFRLRQMQELSIRKEVVVNGGYRNEYEVWSHSPVTRYNPFLGIGYCYRSRGDGLIFRIGGHVYMGDLGNSADFWNARVMGGISMGFTF
ncbi:MAG TPA: hypothetical protein VNN76_08885 [Bacteroidota bacterium]|nr:hypothetical protein [Bacteroidota bacterium]